MKDQCARILKKVLLVRFIGPYIFYTEIRKQKEVRTMKTKKNAKNNNLYIYRHYRRPYPNAADPTYFLNKLVDGLLSVATCMGTITIFFFLVTI